MKSELIYYPHKILMRKAEFIQRFDDSLQKLLQDMEFIMTERRGVGIAAPQVNRSLCCFLVYYDETIHRFINPEITYYSEYTDVYEEGCLSIPGIFANVKRATKIRVKAQDIKGAFFEIEVEGYFARIIQHEFDHIQGILFIDYLRKGMRTRVLNAYEKLQSEQKLVAK